MCSCLVTLFKFYLYSSLFIATVTLPLSGLVNMILGLFLQKLLVEFFKNVNVLSILFSLTFLLINQDLVRGRGCECSVRCEKQRKNEC